MASNLIPNLADVSSQLYLPLEGYQTRILILAGGGYVPEAPLRCQLRPAKALCQKFYGLEMGSEIPGEMDELIEFEALSYVWGSGGRTHTIMCNNILFPITRNLFDALKALRPSGRGFRYLWADAICINQTDELEKALQVNNMFQIYQLSKTVIVWLGPVPDGGPDEIDQFPDPECFLFHPWFERMWVQQESFAPRYLQFQYGTLTISDRAFFRQESDFGPVAPERVDKSSKTFQWFQHMRLNWWRRQHAQYSIFPNVLSPSFVSCLLYSSPLKATDPRDYIYGLLGIAGFPAKAMTIQAWLETRENEIFIPIDYTADFKTLLCCVTWALLMKIGPSVITKFKCMPMDPTQEELPSWVIDWRLAGQVVTQDFLIPNGEKALLNGLTFGSSSDKVLFQSVNSKPNSPYNWLIVRGYIETKYSIRDGWVAIGPIPPRQKKEEFLKCMARSPQYLYLGSAVEETDIFVRSCFNVGDSELRCHSERKISRQSTRGWHSRSFAFLEGGLLILRPMKFDQYRMIAYLDETVDRRRGPQSRHLKVEDSRFATQPYYPLTFGFRDPDQVKDQWPTEEDRAHVARDLQYFTIV